MSCGDIDRAIADYSAAIRLDPKDGDYYLSRSKAWHARGDRTAPTPTSARRSASAFYHNGDIT
jgi:hypothetical protein